MREKGKGGMREMPRREKDYIETEKRERKRKREDKGAASGDKLVTNRGHSGQVRKKR